jgi:putative transposase
MPARDALPRGRWHKMWKSVSARALIAQHALHAPVWQADTFDHLLRNAESYSEKWEYVRQNPVRAGLYAQPEDWPWQGEIHSLRF